MAFTRCRSASVSTPIESYGVSATMMGTPFCKKRSWSSLSANSKEDCGKEWNRDSVARV